MPPAGPSHRRRAPLKPDDHQEVLRKLDVLIHEQRTTNQLLRSILEPVSVMARMLSAFLPFAAANLQALQQGCQEVMAMVQQATSQSQLQKCCVLGNAISACTMAITAALRMPKLLQRTCTSQTAWYQWRQWGGLRAPEQWLGGWAGRAACKLASTGGFLIGWILLAGHLWTSIRTYQRTQTSASHAGSPYAALWSGVTVLTPQLLLNVIALPGLVVVPGLWLTRGSILTWLLIRLVGLAPEASALAASTLLHKMAQFYPVTGSSKPRSSSASQSTAPPGTNGLWPPTHGHTKPSTQPWLLVLSALWASVVLPVAGGLLPYCVQGRQLVLFAFLMMIVLMLERIGRARPAGAHKHE